MIEEVNTLAYQVVVKLILTGFAGLLIHSFLAMLPAKIRHDMSSQSQIGLAVAGAVLTGLLLIPADLNFLIVDIVEWIVAGVLVMFLISMRITARWRQFSKWDMFTMSLAGSLMGVAMGKGVGIDFGMSLVHFNLAQIVWGCIGTLLLLGLVSMTRK